MHKMIRITLNKRVIMHNELKIHLYLLALWCCMHLIKPNYTVISSISGYDNVNVRSQY